MLIPVVENPRRKRRKTTRRKRRYTARRTYTRRYSAPARKPRRRNPMLASLGNPRRRRSSRRSYRRNAFPGVRGFDFGAAVWVGTGICGSELVPSLIRKSVWSGLPSTGPLVYVVKAGGTLITAYAVKMLTRSNRNFQLVMAGGLAMILVDVFREYAAPRLGLSGYVGNDRLITAGEVQEVYEGGGSAGYVSNDNLAAYVESPVGAY